MLSTPGLALDAATSPDPTQFAPVLSHVANVQASTAALVDQQAQDQSQPGDNSSGGDGGIFGAIGHWISSVPGVNVIQHAVGSALHYFTAPIREVQRDYRYLHMVWTKEGPVAGFLSTLGVVGGATVGGLLGGPGGAALGAEGATALERQISETGIEGQNLRQIADDSANPNIKISIGRDLASGLGQIPGFHALGNTDVGVGKVVSGLGDAAVDWTADPVVVAAKLKTGMKLGELGSASKELASTRIQAGAAEADAAPNLASKLGIKATNAIHNVFNGDYLRTMQTDGASRFFDNHAPGINLTPGNSESLINLYNAPLAGASYRRALDDIVNINSRTGPGAAGVAAGARLQTNSADILAHYPELQDLVPSVLRKTTDGGTQVTLPGLGAATTRDEAHQVFVNVAENQNFADRLTNVSVVPTRTLTRAGPSKLADWAQSIDSKTPVDQQQSLIGAAKTVVTAPLKALGSAATGNLTGAVGNLADAGEAVTGAIARKVRTFSGYLPYSLDKNTQELSAHEFSVDSNGVVDPTAAKGILNTFRFSMGTQRARYWTDQFLNAPDLAAQKRIWAEGNFEMLKAAGLPDKNDLVTNVRQQLADIEAGPMSEPGGQGVYGFGATKGTDVALQPSADSMVPGALWSHQSSSTFSFPDFNLLKQQMRELQGSIKANYGRADDFMNRAYTRSLFKPLALLNAGFGFRVAMAESIPQAMRVGAMQTLRDQVNAKTARENYKLLPNEDDHILAAASHALSDPEDTGAATFSAKQIVGVARRAAIQTPRAGMWNGVNRLLNDPIARERAMGLIIRHQGHIAQGVARTGEASGGWHVDQDPPTKANIAAYTAKGQYKNHPQIQWAGSKDFDTYSRDAEKYDGFWHGALSRVSQEKPAQLIAQDLRTTDVNNAILNEADRMRAAISGDPSALEAYSQEAGRLRGYDNIRANNWTPEDFAANRVDALRGLTEGEDGTVHTDLLDQIAAGQKPELDSLAQIPKESRPAQVYGPMQVPYIGHNVLQRIISGGFTKFIDPIINGLSRDPMYFNSFSHELDSLKPAIESGHLDEETANRIAETRAAVSMLPKIHNTALRSQFAVLARNYMPFYFAQEQALRRAGRLIATHPEALRQYQLVEHGLNDPGFVHTDDQGNKFFMFPSMGGLQAGANGLMGLFGDSVQAGLPMTVQGSMSSLNTLLPDFQMPGVSPMVSVPLNKLTDIFPELSPTVKEVVGGRGFGQSVFDAIVPHPVAKAAWRVLNPDEKDKAYANALFGAMASSFYHGSSPATNASDAEKADWINRMRNNARSSFIVKGLLGLVSPLAPQVSNEDPGMRDEFYKEVKKSGYKQALADFLEKHGTKAISYTVAHTQPTIPGAYLPETKQAINWINSPTGSALLNSPLSKGAAFLVPQAQGPGDVQTIHAELIRDHLRQQDTPRQFLDAIDIALGNNAIDPALKVHTQAVQAAGTNRLQVQAENQNWSNYVTQRTLLNPTWGAYWASPQRTQFAKEAWVQLKAIFQNNLAPNNNQSQIALGLLEDFQAHSLALAQSTSPRGVKAEKANWNAHLDQLANDPLAFSIVNAVFRRLDAAGLQNEVGAA